MDLAVFYEVVVPLIEMGNSVLIMISTPVDSFNFFSALLDLKDPDTGLPVFLVYDVELICKRCKKKERPSDCNHMLKFLPPWKSADKQKSVRLILKNQQNILQRESMGVVSNDGTSLIEHIFIQRFIKRSLWRPEPMTNPKWVIVAYDPNSSGKLGSSESAISAMFIYNGQRVVKKKKNLLSFFFKMYNLVIHVILLSHLLFCLLRLSIRIDTIHLGVESHKLSYNSF